MEVIAKANNIRMSPRKVRLVIDVIRGMDVMRAQTQLQFMKKAAVLPVLKLLNSAIANAEHNFQLDKENLFVKTITADGGPTIHRWTPKAFGRAAPIRKRTSHITIVLSDAEIPKKKSAKVAKKKEVKPKEVNKVAAKKSAAKKTK
ncbi:50S ribosomal protein L22 [Candidatus Uhrbacteria bacterium RIFOXYB12_FULL_58_10]|uniref:Large ribosomal subunit protein uL22 n=1 Tax=Candidatus Uhrbacteria bacterium RIFOXYB2_FULL_57_15 TaxID=1802422 RepID=A0A1F7W8D0_9BACT|nr:MAG: 50S ribosomal protein L22 [Candidatus Uhrbacteria bacterium RIFOXYB12_FULL_58_10]OGL99030.1 MAG: 50S ribosomal protein L22 [Candidatus Uhrbacteria bacterium RIFOXYB2_FULL_57_15]OGM00250.1 MAG: 50S ribosomal protein L22 [Candidatus Uhrbacteria bacterium RIFOXYC12_FULL_57_11]